MAGLRRGMLGVLLGFEMGLIGDLAAPFVIQDDKKISSWELRGYAVPRDEGILLLPPVAYQEGSLWSDIELPSSWEATFTFRIDKANGGSLMICLSNVYGVDSTQGGVRISIRFNTESFSFTVDKNGETWAVQNGVQPPCADFVVKVGVSDGAIVVSHNTLSERIPLDADAKQLFLGVACWNERSSTRIDLLGVAFGGGLGVPTRRDIEAADQARVNFNRAGRDFGQWAVRELDDVFRGILNVSRLAEEMPSFTLFNDVVLAGVLPHVEKWHRRVLTVVQDCRELRYRLNETTNGVLAALRGMSEKIQANSDKARRRASRVTTAFLDEFDALPGVGVPETGWTTGKVLPVIGVFELAAFAGFVLLLKTNAGVRQFFAQR